MKKNNTHIEMGIPAVLPLALGQIDVDGVIKPVLLGVALQHPPIHFFVAKHKEMTVYGPRADVARANANKYAKSSGASQPVEIKIDNTSPSMVGFGSDSMLALGAAQAVAWANDHAFEDVATLDSHVQVAKNDPLAYWGYQKGGFLIVELEEGPNGKPPALLKHHTLEHRSHLAWAFVFHFPKVPANTPESIEMDRLKLMKTAVSHIPVESGQIMMERLWPALEQDDFDTFATALMQLIQMNQKALVEQNAWHIEPDISSKIFDVFEKEQVSAWGASLTGIGIYGFLKGSLKSQEVRTRLLSEVGYFSGQYDATVSDPIGARITSKNEDLHLHDYKYPNLQPGISGPGRNKS
ncbi:MAG: hypothetical protein AAF490_09350 [Chloroflexota bacterium]